MLAQRRAKAEIDVVVCNERVEVHNIEKRRQTESNGMGDTANPATKAEAEAAAAAGGGWRTATTDDQPSTQSKSGKEGYTTAVRYAGTMVLGGGAFKSSFAGGLLLTDPDVRLFDFGFEISIEDKPADKPANPRRPSYRHLPLESTPRNVAFTRNASLSSKCGFVQGNMVTSAYRSMLVELYTRYMRAGAKDRGRHKVRATLY